MKKREIIKYNREFEMIMNKGKKYQNKYFYICVHKNDLNRARFGISIPKKIGKAVVRNKLKRQIKSIIDEKKDYLKPLDYVIIIKTKGVSLSFNEIKNNLLSLIFKMKEEN